MQQVEASRPDEMRHHEVTARFLHIGIGSMAFEDNDGYLYSSHGNWSVGIGVNYSYWFSRHIGVTTGLSTSYLFYSEKLSNLATTSRGIVMISDGEGKTAYTATMAVLTPEERETKNYTMIEVPLLLSFRANHLYANVGASIATSLSTYSVYDYSPSTYHVSEIEGLGVSFSGVPVRTKEADGGGSSYLPASVKRPLFYMVSAEVGWLFHFDQRNMLSLSIYGSYALNKCQPDVATSEVVDVSQGVAHKISPMQAGLVNGYRYCSVGLCVAYHFGFGRPFTKRIQK